MRLNASINLVGAVLMSESVEIDRREVGRNNNFKTENFEHVLQIELQERYYPLDVYPPWQNS